MMSIPLSSITTTMSKKNKIIQSLTFFIVLGLFSTTLYANSFRVLVFSKTEGFRHSSIPTGIAAITQLGQEYGFIVEATENAALFNFENLQKFEVIIFLSTTGDVLSIEQQNAFEQYIHNGGGFVGIHAASDTEYDWPWYGKLVGAYFDSHPEIQTATIQVTDQNHISTKHLSKFWERTDEWYNYNKNPRGQVHVPVSYTHLTLPTKQPV